ncbi:hypothetical protein QBC38DRAFT_550101 [Podospora fimiseda]|uniref:Uncharacterized protein n=1 Tax=Podospora fimiseda TaxID=252190 RepID=A0AAN6YR65_9PEZI|nr:hypothetical protein QBC38DRAFT_550101 [Podospora fimiseda]
MPRVIIKQHQRVDPSDTEERRRRVAENIQRLSQNIFDHCLPVSKKTEEAEIRAWQDLESFFRELNPFPDYDIKNAWIDLCLDKPRPKLLFQAFLDEKIRSSQGERPSIGDYETETVQTISVVNSAAMLWRNLVAKADKRILRDQRHQDPSNSEKWRLRWVDITVSKGAPGFGPVADISRDLDLSCRQTFEKRDLTANDIMRLLNTLWTHARDVECRPRQRVAFHSTLLLAGFGFRPGCIVSFPYKQVRIRCLRAPTAEYPERIVIWATILIVHNKRRQKAINMSQNETLIISQAIFDKAFKAGYQSFEDLLKTPRLENTECLELEWKEEMLEKEIFPIDYDVYLKLWNRLWLVAGNRDKIRPYSLRVGAGAALDDLPLTISRPSDPSFTQPSNVQLDRDV